MTEPYETVMMSQLVSEFQAYLKGMPRVARRDDPARMVGNLSPDERAKLSSAFDEIQTWLQPILSTGTCTTGFLLDLASCVSEQIINGWNVVEAIARLEGDLRYNRGLKPPTRYSRKSLQGLWHAHFFDARFIPQNLINANSLALLKRRLQPYVGRAISEVSDEISHAMIVTALDERACQGALTGECIIFEVTPIGNRYLTLRLHHEADEDVAERIVQYSIARWELHTDGSRVSVEASFRADDHT